MLARHRAATIYPDIRRAVHDSRSRIALSAKDYKKSIAGRSEGSGRSDFPRRAPVCCCQETNNTALTKISAVE
jgi:hypothetical protein